MLTLENISFGVKDEKGEKEIIKNLNLSIGENKLWSSPDRTAVESPHWRN